MTLSKETRWKNIEVGILLLMEGLEGRSILEVFIEEHYLDDRIQPTTWDELKERCLVRQTNVPSIYTLSGPGWLAGLKLRNEFDTDDMKVMAGNLCGALKSKVKGRHHEAMVHVEELATESGIPSAFIINAIESDLIRELFNIKGAEWASHQDRAKFIIIPSGFGMEPL